MIEEKEVFSIDLSNRKLTIEVGEVAKQANGACMIHYGDTSILSVAVSSKEPKDLPFFPLTVNYEERLYAVGKIPGGFIKREGRPSENAVLASRLIDRPIRPLFPEGFRHEVQVTNTVLSVDQDCSPEITAMIGSSLALAVSDIPFAGPIAGVTVGRVDGKFIINPSIEEQEKSDLNLTVAGTKDAINMVEAGANIVPEEVILEAIMFGHKEIVRLVEFQEEIIEAVGLKKQEVEVSTLDEKIYEEVKEKAYEPLVEAIRTVEKLQREDKIDDVKEEILSQYDEEEEELLEQVEMALDQIVEEEVRRMIIEDNIRPDGRKNNDIRPLSSRIQVLSRTHGSGLFTRGQTQTLSVCTLGALGDVQILDGIDLEESKRFMHHYNFPQYSVGETGPMRAPGRREIGHGALGEKALDHVIPSEEEFPYTIRLVSEVLESNGSSSQASICSSTLALMDAGVPIKAPVAGIAMGLVKEGDQYSILSDILGMEDALGDMDFKVAGTKEGITALQMDIKIDGLSEEILRKALEQARIGRLHIIDSMMKTIDQPKKDLSPYAPKIVTMTIDPDKIRDVIGPSGKQINEIIDETGVKIDIEQDGSIFISSSDEEMNERAKEIIEDLVAEVEVGKMYLGTVKRIERFGAFVEVLKGQEGLVHISEMDTKHIRRVEDVVSIGDEIMVKVKEIDHKGRINLSRKAVLMEEQKRHNKV